MQIWTLGLASVALACAATVSAEDTPPDFTGKYNGNAFETASGLWLKEDGTFEWYLAVGALDMSASGTWTQDGDVIKFASEPRPVPPEFVWKGFDTTVDTPFLRVEYENGEPFDNAVVTIICRNGQRLNEVAQLGIWSPSEDDECDEPEKLRFRFNMMDLDSRPFDLNNALKPEPGQTLVFQFKANDFGTADFTGVTGTLDHGVLTLVGLLGNQMLRKIEAKPEGGE